MLTPILLLAPLALAWLLFRHLQRKRDPKELWRSSARIGLMIGIPRALLASAGWYVVEHTGGPLQIPAFALAMLAWPEAAIFGPRRGAASLGFYMSLIVLLVVSSLVAVSAVTLAVQWSRVQRD